jgi:hypothetical protein
VRGSSLSGAAGAVARDRGDDQTRPGGEGERRSVRLDHVAARPDLRIGCNPHREDGQTDGKCRSRRSLRLHPPSLLWRRGGPAINGQTDYYTCEVRRTGTPFSPAQRDTHQLFIGDQQDHVLAADIVAHEFGHVVDWVYAGDRVVSPTVPGQPNQGFEVEEGLADMFAQNFDPYAPTLGEDLPGGFVTDWAVPKGRFELPLPGSMRQYGCTPVNPNYSATILEIKAERVLQYTFPGSSTRSRASSTSRSGSIHARPSCTRATIRATPTPPRRSPRPLDAPSSTPPKSGATTRPGADKSCANRFPTPSSDASRSQRRWRRAGTTVGVRSAGHNNPVTPLLPP